VVANHLTVMLLVLRRRHNIGSGELGTHDRAFGNLSKGRLCNRHRQFPKQSKNGSW